MFPREQPRPWPGLVSDPRNSGLFSIIKAVQLYFREVVCEVLSYVSVSLLLLRSLLTEHSARVTLLTWHS